MHKFKNRFYCKERNKARGKVNSTPWFCFWFSLLRNLLWKTDASKVKCEATDGGILVRLGCFSICFTEATAETALTTGWEAHFLHTVWSCFKPNGKSLYCLGFKCLWIFMLFPMAVSRHEPWITISAILIYSFLKIINWAVVLFGF